MPLGTIVRNALGPFERVLCHWYRAFFINIPRCIEHISAHIPQDASVIDVGGGDGQVIDQLLRRRPDIHVTMIDRRESIGLFIQPDVINRTSLHARMSLSDYTSSFRNKANVLFACDVLHHIPVEDRVDFILECHSLIKPGGRLIIKDLAPQGIVAFLARFTDRYITGDRHVEHIGEKNLSALVHSHLDVKHLECILPKKEYPNYALRFDFD